MSANNSLILDKGQMGLEGSGSRGVGVPATRKIYADLAGSYNKAIADITDKSGTFEARRRKAYGRESAAFTFTDVATYEDLPFWLLLAVKGGVAPVADANVPIAYTRNFVPSLAVDDLASATLEFNHEGNVYESHQFMINTLTIRFDSDANEPVMVEGSAIALDWEPSAYTAALPERDTEPIKQRGIDLTIDDEGETIGSTPLLDHLISGSFTINNNIEFKGYAEYTKGMAPGKVGRGPRTADLQLTMEWDTDAEFSKYRAEDPVERLVRLAFPGSLINNGGVGADVHNLLQIDAYGMWSSFSPGNRAQSKIATYNLACYFNVAAAQSWSMKVINDVAVIA